MTFPTYKHLAASIDYLFNAHGYTLEQIANKHQLPTEIITVVLGETGK